MRRHTVSLCMIVKNEEKYLDKCLQSAKPHVDEIIIVDTGSTDSTIQIAEKYSAKVSFFTWIDDFAAARNATLQQAVGDYILVMDADEFLDESADLQQDLLSEMDYYEVRIKNVVTNGETVTHPAIRLFRNHFGFRYQGRIHEHINIEDFTNLQYDFANSFLHHIGYLDQVYEERNKGERNFPLLQQAVEENPTGYNYFNLGMQYKVVGRYEDALEAFRKGYPLSKQRGFVTTLLFYMIDCLRRLERFEEGVQLAQDAIDCFPGYTDFYYIKGSLYESLGYNEDALMCFQRCLEIGEVSVVQTLDGVGSYLAACKFGELCLNQGKRVEALDSFYQAIQYKKHHVAPLRGYLHVMRISNVPLESVSANLKSVYPMNSVQDVQYLLGVLYGMKHPLFGRYLEEFNVQVAPNLQAVGKQYSGKYEEARTIWLSLSPAHMQNGNDFDVLLLAMILQDEQLFQLVEAVEQKLSAEEMSWLRKLVNRTANGAEVVPESLVNVLLELWAHCLVLHQYATFEYLSQFLMHASTQTQVKMAQALDQYGFTQGGLDLLLQREQTDPHDPDLLLLLGDLCLKKGRHPQALSRYVEALNQRPDMKTYARLYDFYKQTDDPEGMGMILTEMQRQFPLSQWAKQHQIPRTHKA